MSDQLTFDYTLMMSEMIGEHGIAVADLAALQPRLEAIHQEFLHQKDNNELGFTHLPYDEATLVKVQSLATQIRERFSALVVLGIGGSDLGARAIHEALNHSYYNLLPTETHRLFFAGANTDPKELADLTDLLDWEQTALCVISKSGDTVEPMASFVYLKAKLTEAMGAEAAEHIIVLTDATNGSLRQIVNREGYQSLVVPATVGGRFSVLSTVGLFPLAYAGIDIEQLLAGARDMDERLVSSPITQNPSLLYAGLQFLAYHQGQILSVLMPYATGLRGIAQWYRQLWAESLGKRVDVLGKVVNVGPTPIAAVGATDQHSQIQLYTEGPFDKVVTFIGVEEFSRSVALPEELAGLDELNYLKLMEFGDLIETERKATAMALASSGRPNASILLPRVDEFSLGELIYFMEVATAYSGILYQINPYDQPGVEAGKQNMYALLHKPGFEARVKELDKWLNPPKTYRV